MGLTMAFVVLRVEEAPAEVEGWSESVGTVAGWVAVDADVGMDLTQVASPSLNAVVLDGAVAVVSGWVSGGRSFQWIVNDANAAGYNVPGLVVGEDDQAKTIRRRQVATAMVDWSVAAGLPPSNIAAVDDLLSRDHVGAEDGLFGILLALGVLTRAAVRPAGPLAPVPGVTHRFTPPSAPLDVVGGDASALPVRPQVMYLAAPIDHTGPGWDPFVRKQELEEWGQPACVLATSVDTVPVGGLTSWSPWALYLVTDPALEIAVWHGPLGIEQVLPDLGPWTPVPTEVAVDTDTALAWARDHVGTVLAPPTDRRQAVQTELAEPPTEPRLLARSCYRAAEPTLVVELSTYVDVNERPDDLAAWLTAVRNIVVVPVARLSGDNLTTAYVREEPLGPAYGASLTGWLRRMNGRVQPVDGDDASWQQALTELRRGDLREFHLVVVRLNGEGRSSAFRRPLTVAVEIRNQFTKATGSLLDDHPATITLNVPSSVIEALGGLDVVRSVMRDAAVRLGVVSGYAHGSGAANALQSPYERRTSRPWDGTRLDQATRGIHWGNLIGPRHLAALGGIHALSGPQAMARCTRWEQWSAQPDLWWYEVATNPFGRVNVRVDRFATALAQKP